jgi:acyl carrier protein
MFTQNAALIGQESVMRKPRRDVLGIGALWLLAGSQASAQGTSVPHSSAQTRAPAKPASGAAPPPRRCADAQERVRRILAKNLGVAPQRVLLDTRLVDELGCDSLDAVEVVMAIEDEFGIEIPDEAADRRFGTMRQVVSYLRSRRVCAG